MLRANSTLATTRAQLLPAPFALAIQSQRPTPISPVRMMNATPAISAACSWDAVSGLCALIAALLDGVLQAADRGQADDEPDDAQRRRRRT